MLDIDYFKKINDTFGHNAGDSVLKEVSEIIMKSIREIDTAARYGGEEFMVILPSTDRINAKVAAERMRNAIEQFSFSGVSSRITVSIGIAGMPDDKVDNEDKLIRCSDFALYRAKQLGRNRSVAAEALELEYIDK
jgi:two-component system cell cycle response regulator